MRPHQGPHLPYSVVAGVTPCDAGWLVASAKLRGATFAPEESRLFDSFREVLDVRPSFSIIVINVPIGYLDDSGAGPRSCDREAQVLLGGRSSFPGAPTRAELVGSEHEHGLDGARRLHRLREVANEMTPSNQRVIFEGQPALSFYQLNGHTSLHWSGDRNEDDEERRMLLELKIPGVGRVLEAALPGVTRRELADVAALLWTARRVFGHAATRLPADGEWDSEGLRMELVM